VTTLLVATIGGHLTQLHQLAPRLRGVDTTDRLWVTHDSAQSRSLLDGEDVQFVPYIEERDVVGAAKALLPAARLIRERSIESVVSTGSAIAVPYISAARALRRKAYYIESAAFVRSRSLTARILWSSGANTFTQYPDMVGRGWDHRGWVFDSFDAVPVEPAPVPTSMLVMLGTSRVFGYRSLLERLVQIVPPTCEVTWQTGCTDLQGLDIDARPWIPAQELAEIIGTVDAVVSHAGVGSALGALSTGIRPVLVARRAEDGDVGNDHQLEIAERLSARGLATVRTVETLTWEDIAGSTAWRIERPGELPPFDLTLAR